MKVLKIVPHSWKFLNNHENICIVCKSGLFHIILNSLSIILSQFSLLSKHTNNKNEIETAGKGGRVSKIYWNLLICGDNVDKMREKVEKLEQKEIKIGIWNRNCQDVLLEHLEQTKSNRTRTNHAFDIRIQIH